MLEPGVKELLKGTGVGAGTGSPGVTKGNRWVLEPEDKVQPKETGGCWNRE